MSDSGPLLVYDGDCGICRDAAVWVQRRADVELQTFADLSPADIERLPENWRECAHFLEGDAVYSCGAAMEEAFLRTGHRATPVLAMLRRLPAYAPIRERAYRQFADNRSVVGRYLR